MPGFMWLETNPWPSGPQTTTFTHRVFLRVHSRGSEETHAAPELQVVDPTAALRRILCSGHVKVTLLTGSDSSKRRTQVWGFFFFFFFLISWLTSELLEQAPSWFYYYKLHDSEQTCQTITEYRFTCVKVKFWCECTSIPKCVLKQLQQESVFEQLSLNSD